MFAWHDRIIRQLEAHYALYTLNGHENIPTTTKSLEFLQSAMCAARATVDTSEMIARVVP